MKTFKFRVSYEHKGKEEIYRDVIVAEGQTLEQFHKSLVKAFDFDGDEMASFYMTNEDWEKGTEFPLEDMGIEDDDDAPMPMKKIKIQEVARKAGDRLVYVYDYIRMCNFNLELLEVGAKDEKKKYPLVAQKVGEMPDDELDENDDDDDDLFDDPDLAESYYTKAPIAGGSKGKGKGKKSIEDDDDDLFSDFEDGYDDDDYSGMSSGDFDDY